MDDVKYQKSNYNIQGLEDGEKVRIVGHYNFRFENQLDLRWRAMLRITCSWNKCLKKLKIYWDTEKDCKDQPRYSWKVDC